MPTPEGCADTALAALAQLAALRLNVRRCLISLITSEMEFVLAEATRTMNLQYDTVVDAHDKAWLGTSSFLRADGINDIAVNDWRRARRYRMTPDDEEHYYTEGRSPHWCIFSDARSNDQCKVRAFARRAPSLRFYCSVPLRTPDGTVLGSYTIMDDRPRIGVSAAEMTLLEDMADTVAHHLDAAVIASQSHRSERLIQGLSAFNKGQHSLRQWWMETDVGQGHRGGRHQNRSIDPDLQAARLDEDLGKQEVDTTPPAFERRTQRAKAKADGRQTRIPSISFHFLSKFTNLRQARLPLPRTTAPHPPGRQIRWRWKTSAKVNHKQHPRLLYSWKTSTVKLQPRSNGYLANFEPSNHTRRYHHHRRASTSQKRSEKRTAGPVI